MQGGFGDDYMEGGETQPNNSPQIIYGTSTGPIVADLQAGVVTGQGTDTFENVGSIYGSPYNDTLRGFDADSENGLEIYLYGQFGNDRITGTAGNSVLGNGGVFGQEGSDFINWRTGETVYGGPGPDRLFGRGHLFGEEGNDYLNSQDGSVTATVDGGPNLDTCLTDPGESVVNCE
jgi:hypothetical protein